MVPVSDTIDSVIAALAYRTKSGRISQSLKIDDHNIKAPHFMEFAATAM